MTDDDPYRTVEAAGSASLEVRGSRFTGLVTGVESVEDAETVIERFGASHPDATHLVPAYRVRGAPMQEWYRDAGEPTDSAGRPIVNVLRRESLQNVAAVVARYFGGTKLGRGPLARAYGEAAKQAVRDATVVERRPRVPLLVESTYDDSGTVRGILEGSDAAFDATYEETVRFRAAVPTSTVDELRERLLSATSGRVEICEE